MTEPTTPRQIREAIAAKLATMPANADADGRTDLDRSRDAASIGRTAELVIDEPEASAYAGMKPNPAQGGGATVPTPAPTNVLDAIRAQAHKSL